jgi:hypothetical protein
LDTFSARLYAWEKTLSTQRIRLWRGSAATLDVAETRQKSMTQPEIVTTSLAREFKDSVNIENNNNLRGFSPHANYTDRATAAFRQI